MGLKFEIRVQRSLFLDANIFDPPIACIISENDMTSILKMCKIRNKKLYAKIKGEIWDKIDSRIVDDI